MQKKKKEKIIKFTLLTVSTFLILLVVEIFLRFFYPTPYYGYPSIPPQQQFFQYDSLLGWKGTPDASGIFAGEDFYVSVTHDHYGYRNVTSPYIDGKENILVLGDSFGWGWGVENDELFSSYITDNHSHINVYNLSAPGYGTGQEYLNLKRFLEDNNLVDYRGVILLFYSNDFKDVAATERYSYPKPRFVMNNNNLVLENVPIPELTKEKYDRINTDYTQSDNHSFTQFHVYNLIEQQGSSLAQKIMEKLFGKDDKETHTTHMASNLIHTTQTHTAENSQKTTFSLLKEIDMLCKRNDMFLHVILLMTSKTRKSGKRKIEQLAPLLHHENITFSYFHSRVFPATDLWLDGHLSKYGHKVLALHILKILQENEGISSITKKTGANNH